MSHMPTKTALVTKAQSLLNVVMTANPIGIVVVAVAALAVGFYVLYQSSETFRMMVNKVWEVVKTVGRQVLPVLLFPFVAAWEGIKMAWEPAKAFFGLLWNGIKTVAKIHWAVISTVATAPWKLVKAVWNGAVSFFRTIWEAIKAPAITLWETIAAAATWCVNVFRPIWEPVVAVFAGIWEGITAPAVAVFNWIGEKFDWIAGKFQWLSDTWAKVNGWFSDDDEGGGLTVAQAETKVNSAAVAKTTAVNWRCRHGENNRFCPAGAIGSFH
jgi:phage-related protein